MSKRALVSLVLLLFRLGAIGQEKIAPELLLEDLKVLKNKLETLHPGLYNHTSKADMDAQFDRIESQLIEPYTEIEFYRILAPLHAYIKNGHTILIPSASFDDATENVTPQFPLDVYWDNEELYVLRNNSNNTTIEVGSRIDSINGKYAPDIFKILARLWTRDGSNITFPQGITQRAFAGFYINIFGESDVFDIQFTGPEGESKSILLEPLAKPEIDKNRTLRYGDIHYYWNKSDGNAVTLKITGDVAHLEIKTCSNSDIRRLGHTIRGIMKDYFREMSKQNVVHLIVDLRNNGGGDEIISRELLKHISDKPFLLFDDSYMNVNRIKDKKLFSENVSWLNLFSKLGLKKGKDGLYRLNGFGRMAFRSNPKFKTHEPYKDKFEGKVYTLTNGYSFSSAGEIASAIKTNTKSVFIGEEPGGNASRVVAGLVYTLTLPHSKNRLRLPFVNQLVHTTVKESDRGVIPDYRVRNTISDELERRDAIMDFTLNLIHK